MKNKLTAISAAVLTLCLSAMPFTAYAAEEVGGTEPLYEAATESSESADNSDSIDWQALKDAYTEEFLAESENIEAATKDYFSDDYYDTDGNATLIDSQVYDVIYSGEALLFTSVTTKDGHVFYILVNYADEDGEDNVYFLNKVDDYDLYSLLYAGGENGENTAASQIAQYEQQTTARADKTDSRTTETAAADEAEQSAKSASGGNMMTLIIGGGLVLLLGIGAFVVPKLIGGGKKKKEIIIEDDDLDEFSEDE